MPGIINSPLSDSSVGAVAGMKRVHDADSVPTYGAPHPKKQKVTHQLRYTQPVQYIADPISAEIGDFGDSKEFFHQQLRRSVAIQCKAQGFDSASPEALEEFTGLVDSYMTKFLSQVQKSMSSARRTETVPHDWVYALVSSGLRGSGPLESHLDTGDVPPSLLQPHFDPPAPPEAPPPDTESLLGPGLSGKADKEARPYIPSHFPPFPSRHTYKSTPVFTERENDPRKIREKATEEGILAEQSLRKLMAAQKAGIQKRNAGRRKRSARMKKSDELWQAAMTDLLAEEKQNDKEEERQRAMDADEEPDWDAPMEARPRQAPVTVDRNVNLEEGVHVNYEQRFWRKSARGG
ncbi:transcription initiation factor TFIID subunit 8 [Parastagonospora nodorum]|uniref:Transcription initiation factor TFIID subunit 8 n=1 Tax=Phaeosphaeria nodorum (strain SN15 / ATCC MYA-4574 / FGSC 10173) TaxID=321614 RepID=A0A7U2NQ27_PHANO|nr:transcription initiation factor TFIID subunit 8 [Parastagonospora nodorum]QRD06284.1 transcription initiation factor TFIID subunit 8 [Parastagonospora nodorum SN15]KAH3932109.1 transcription initiation factor TFIID subunit 8 [Parastagonospora nodorum]KAH3947518.1 transcription initiation factor TFIID subunit 8 [Parastagonospora nodorum]KAH3969077.1 transcription initiation factor TFIID subunit 8 [Parastagonospora nodorum]